MPRPPSFSPVVQLVIPCMCRNSSLKMAHAIHSETSISNEKQVEISKNDDTFNDKHGNAASTPPARKRTVDKVPILRHLGLNTSQQRPIVREFTSKKIDPSSSAIDNGSCIIDMNEHARTSTSELSLSSSNEPFFLSVKDVNHEEKSSLPSCSGCTLATNESQTSGLGEWSPKASEYPDDVDYTRLLEEHSLPTSFGKHVQTDSRKPNSSKLSLKDGSNRNKSPMNKRRAPFEVFDICYSEADDDSLFQRSPLGFLDETYETEMEKLNEEPIQILRPGMVLLKSYLSNDEQVFIVRKCRELGVGPGGFYRPGYKDGAKLRLYMMCLGLDWDPQTRKYQNRRRIDRSKPPSIASEFRRLVDKAMEDSHALIRRDFKVSNAEDMLPQMNPNVCIVNFYTESGRLGLHQDRDESRESLSKGLPVISFSLGDSAEFLYGDQRDINTAQKLVLKSGDVLTAVNQDEFRMEDVPLLIMVKPDT